MTLDSYRNFVTIVDCGSIVAAANKLLIAQPSLSNQLKNIEKTYGAKLLLRGNRSLELTDAGRIFYKRAKEICMLADHQVPAPDLGDGLELPVGGKGDERQAGQ